MENFQKDKFDSLTVLWQGAWNQFNERRRYEWKGSMAVWTFYAAYMTAILSGKFPTLGQQWPVLVSVLLAILAILHFRWLHGIASRNQIDQKIALSYEPAMKDMVGVTFDDALTKMIKDAQGHLGDMLGHWSHSSQLGITVALCVASIFVTLNVGEGPTSPTTPGKHGCCCLDSGCCLRAKPERSDSCKKHQTHSVDPRHHCRGQR